jgi:hypothetical protein
MLKANFDAGRDHIEMFQPFVIDCVAQMPREDFVVDEIRDVMLDRHSLRIPADTLRVLLGRLAHRRVIRREGGRYFRSAATTATDLVTIREEVEQRQRGLAQALLDFARPRGVRLGSADDALAIILDFLGRYHVALALADPAGVPALGELEPEETTEPRRGMVVVASFLREVVTRDDALTNTLQEMLEGFVLQNAAFLKDISEAGRRFQNLEVFLDTALVLAATGLKGEAAEVAMKEGLALLRDTGARLGVFDVTLKETRRILAVYEEHLATSEGRLTLHPTEVTRFVLTKRYTPSDIREIGALLERRLLDIGVHVRELPARRQEYTLDEEALTRKLSNSEVVGPVAPRRRNGGDPRVQHDVDCVAGVLQLRAGRRAASLDHSRAVFATASWITLKSTIEWFEAQDFKDVPPIIHHLSLSNAAWLKKPASAVKLKLQELVALCSAVLIPGRKLWEAFVRHLRGLRERGQLTSDEVTTIVASHLTDNFLIEQDREEGDFDSDSLTEVVERVKASYQEDASRQVATAERKVLETEHRVQQMHATAERRAAGMAKAVCNAVVAVAVVALVLGTVLAIPGVRTHPTAWDWIPTGVLALLSLMGVL